MSVRRGRLAWLTAVMIAVVAGVAFLVVRAAQGPDVASPPGCPALVAGSNNAATDYADAFEWNDRHYWDMGNATLETPPPLGRQLTTVGCSIAELTAQNHQNVENLPWPDRTATFLPSGSPVYAIRGVQHRCRVAIHDGPHWKIYTAIDLDSGAPMPCG